MKVFVTGGAGFIGSHVSRLLLDQGHQVTVFDNFSTGFERLVDGRAKLIKGDLENQEEIEKALTGHDAIIHMAAFIEVGESVKFPIKFTQNNIINSLKLFEAAKNVGVKKIIFSSSACVYGVPKKLPIVETDPLGDQENPYGVGKIAVENFLTVYHKLYNFDVVILRYFNPFGPGELHNPETHAIPNLVKSALLGKPIPLYWKGEQVRDFIYVEDLAAAHTAVLEISGFEIFNIGTEKGVKVKDVLEEIFKILGKRSEIQDLGERLGDVPANYASSAKIKEKLGWQAKYSLNEGLLKTIDFFRKELKIN